MTEHSTGYARCSTWDFAVHDKPPPASTMVMPAHIDRQRRNHADMQRLTSRLIVARYRGHVPPQPDFAPMSNKTDMVASAQPTSQLHISIWFDHNIDMWILLAHNPTTGEHIERFTHRRVDVVEFWKRATA